MEKKGLLLKKMIPYAGILIVWLIFVYPSLFNAGWFFYDIPTSIKHGKNMINDFSWLLPNNNVGRYFPFYWLYQGVIYRMVGESPSGYYMIQSVLIFLTTLVIFKIVKQVTENNIYAVIAVFMFYSGSPFAENAYTLGKSEPLVLILILSSIVFYIKYYYFISAKENSYKKEIYIYGGAIILSTALGVWTKETSIVVIAFGLVGSAVALYGNYVKERKVQKSLLLKANLMYLLSSVVGIAIARLPFYVFRSPELGKSYTSYPITINLIVNNLKFYIKQ